MRTALLLAAVSIAACKPKTPTVDSAAPAPAAIPAPAQPLNDNAVEKYVGGLQNDVKRAQDAKTKADAAVKSADEANEVSQ